MIERFKSRRAAVPAVLVLCLSTLIPPLLAAGGERSKKGFFLGVWGVQTRLGGDLDGKSTISDGTETFLVPKIESAAGYGLSLGRRADAFSQEIVYYQIRHDLVWKDLGAKATTHWLEYVPKFYLATRSALQPFTSLAVSYMWLTAENCASQGGTSGNATFYGLGLNLQGGLSLYLNPRLAIHGSGGYRILMIGQVKGVAGQGRTIEQTVWANGPSFAGGLTLTF
jgi:hypothetical protein